MDLLDRVASQSALRRGHETGEPGLGVNDSPSLMATDHFGGLRGLPCQLHDSDLWFADDPADLEFAKQLCVGCPVRTACLAEAIRRNEPTGVWGGQIFDNGKVIANKRPRGRPRTNPLPVARIDAPTVGRLASHATAAVAPRPDPA